jgi:phosphoribosylamine---glycine ligase
VRVLVLGSGGREHALVRSLAGDGEVSAVACAPGNPGIGAIAEVLPADLADPDALGELAAEWGADLVVVGPEAPLVAGAADSVRARGIACLGPSAQAARLEGSKAFAKEVMAAAGVPTASAVVCETESEAAAALDSFGPPYVVKDDGLAGGKGVVVTSDRAEAMAHAAGSGRVVVEEFLDGPEVSLLCLCDGSTVVPLAPAQDFKRVGDLDAGPNTGGMGAYSPLPWAPAGLTADVVDRVVRPTLREMERRGTPFTGVLYVGLALTGRGPRVVEFNVRFGDPETQVVLARLETGLGRLLWAAAVGRLADLDPLEWSAGAAVTVVLAAPGYPDAPKLGDPIGGVEDADSVGGVHVLHAGTRLGADGELVSSGGRVLGITAVGDSLAEARVRAYRAVRMITLAGGRYRGDIAAEAAGAASGRDETAAEAAGAASGRDETAAEAAEADDARAGGGR